MVEVFPDSSLDVLDVVDNILKKLSSLILGDGDHHFILENHLVEVHGEEGQGEEGDDASSDIVGNEPNADTETEDDQPNGFHEKTQFGDSIFQFLGINVDVIQNVTFGVLTWIQNGNSHQFLVNCENDTTF